MIASRNAARSRGRPAGIAACAAAFWLAAAGVSPAAGAVQGVQPAFNVLVAALQNAQAQPSDAGRRAVAQAAKNLEDAIQVDGGARRTLMAATRNIVASLQIGGLNAEASLQTLQRIASYTVIDPGPWRPGPLYPEPVGLNLHQRAEGDCVGISALKAFSTTQMGEAILRRAVAADPNGGYVVNLPGAPSRVFHVPAQALGQYGVGDPAAAAIVGALFQYFGLDPHHASLPTNKVMELLAGDLGRHARLADASASPQQIEDFLMRRAPVVGVDVAMVFGGKPGRGADGVRGAWTRGDGHAFAILRIDPASRTVFYTNPWNEGVVHGIAISELASQASGASADFEITIFSDTPS